MVERRGRLDVPLPAQQIEPVAQPATRRMARTVRPSLSPMHDLVVREWFALGCVSKKRAMIAAGYSESTPSSSVFGRDDVKDAIEVRRARVAGKTKVTEERIIEELAKLAFTNMGDLLEVNEDGSAFLDLNGMTDAHRAALSEVTTEEGLISHRGAEGEPAEIERKVKTKVKFASKQAALDTLVRVFGMAKDKIEISAVSSFAARINEARKQIGQARIIDALPEPQVEDELR